ncbi:MULTISPECIES: GGDEF domain-containing protein [unclassified Beijerinckia]|uniref:GGDEF domain-containing protein n=1 Tax=unclassified Beijerinckia TaxID=2638183 RepID=UPI0008974A9C|nr:MULTISPECIES: GGDEF domain-containing protein [unclassified Beijerinckia]MDH7795089.1 diguanylate cyclase (GGDEF)-like protein [Beijerinckia sp. GAS462]SEB87133.1 diguanylate cyclase (GGDEF) domain-containing protein [Beijerinckia sp. 28-YEA-48]
MDSTTAFVIVSVMMLANGSVLGLLHRDLPVNLRPAALSWQAGTLLVAAGCVVFAFEGHMSLPVTVTFSNGAFLLGLTAYVWALERFYGQRPTLLHLIPAFIGTFCVFWFSTFHPNTKIRIIIVAIAWVWLMGAAVRTLLAHPDSALSRRMLTFILIAAIVFTAARVLFYIFLPMPPDFKITDNSSWMNLATPLFMTILPVVGATAFVLMCSDQIRRKWEHAASTDYLTGLANRRTLTETGTGQFRLAAERSARLAVAVLDIDAFKAINDTYGHEFGDQALIHVAGRLQAGTRKMDLVARSGGEEFVVLLNDLDQREAEAAAERLRLSVEADPFRMGTTTVPITVSVGVAIHQTGDGSFADIMRRADKALYRAKSEGRNRVELAA